MPTQFAALDAGFPKLTGHESTEQKVDALYNYTFMLLEYLRYVLRNLGPENFNDKELDGYVKTITTPINVSIKDVEEELSTQIDVQAGRITSEITRATEEEGDLSSRITQTESDITMKVSKNSVISEINQSAEQIRISANKVELDGKVSFSDLSTVGRTTINGNNITTGEIHAIDIYGSEFMDAGGNAGLDVTSSPDHERLRFGMPNQAYEYGTFGIDSYDDGNTQNATMRLFGMDILKRHGYGTSGVEAMGRWDFTGPIILANGYTYGSSLPASGVTGQLFFVI